MHSQRISAIKKLNMDKAAIKPQLQIKQGRYHMFIIML